MFCCNSKSNQLGTLSQMVWFYPTFSTIIVVFTTQILNILLYTWTYLTIHEALLWWIRQFCNYFQHNIICNLILILRATPRFTCNCFKLTNHMFSESANRSVLHLNWLWWRFGRMLVEHSVTIRELVFEWKCKIIIK